MHYFEDLKNAMGDRQTIQLPDTTEVRAFHGKADALVIKNGNREIDLSQGPDGQMLGGIETRTKFTGHDDERDTVTEMRPFPETEEDIRFMTELAAAIRSNRENSGA